MSDAITIRMLGSGSSGNCVFVRVAQTRILIDAGISCRRIKKALAEIDESPAQLDAILVTHEHRDHIKGLKTLASKYPEIPIFATRGTTQGSLKHVESTEHWRTIRAETTFEVAQIEVHPFKLSHDAREPTGFRLDAPGFSMALATDLGVWNDTTLKHLSGCQVLILEANHDLQMLRTGPYPPYLQRRVASSRGHLSNAQTRAFVSRLPQPRPEWLILAHLSLKNNSPELAVSEVSKALGDEDPTRIRAATPTPGAPIKLSPRASTQRSSKSPKQGVLFG